MNTYEFPAEVTEDGIRIPPELADLIRPHQTVRVLVMVPEQAPYDTDLTREEEHKLWMRFAAEQLHRQYSEADEIYDRM